MADTIGAVGRPRRQTKIIAALAGLLVLGGIAAVVVNRDEARPKGPARTLLPAPVGVSPERQELLSLLAAQRSRPLHARYSTSDGERLEHWRDGGRYRQETKRRDPDGTAVQSVSIHRPEGDVACRRRGDGPWTCRRAPAPPEPESIALEDLEGRSVSVREASIQGKQARCFTITSSDQSAELCFDRRGTLLLMTTGSVRLELEEADEGAGPDVFDPPGPVVD